MNCFPASVDSTTEFLYFPSDQEGEGFFSLIGITEPKIIHQKEKRQTHERLSRIETLVGSLASPSHYFLFGS
jgi:hypothetical protein